MTAPRRVAVLGGTFDPVHRGHVSVIDQVVAMLGADEGRLVPAAVPPHRAEALAPAALRLEMVRAAVAALPALTVDDIEISRGGRSYTIDTLEEWARREPDTDFHIVLGADAARLMPTWHRANDLLGTGHFVLINRSGVPRVDVTEARDLGFLPDRTRLLQVVSPEVSASEIRRRLAAGEPVDGMVEPAVLAVIRREHLYGT